jgi:arylformamidase
MVFCWNRYPKIASLLQLDRLLVLLSHKLSIDTPSFAGGPSLTITPVKEIRTGGSSNSYSLSLPAHLGTHVDAPKHFDERGKAIADYAIASFLFRSPLLLDIPKGESEYIEDDDLRVHQEPIARADLLLLRTKFQSFRDSDPMKYMNRNPGVSAKAAIYLAGFPNLRALGIDFVSLSAAQNREEGRKAHGALLVGRDFFIIEDMDLSAYPQGAKSVLVLPLFIKGIDSAPCTVVAAT